MTALLWNRYGKSSVRLVRVRRQRDRHDIVDLTVDVQLEGAFDPVYEQGDNRLCLATDTMKNTVYAIARQEGIVHVESFAERLAAHFATQPAVSRVIISAVEQPWMPPPITTTSAVRVIGAPARVQASSPPAGGEAGRGGCTSFRSPLSLPLPLAGQRNLMG